MKKRGSSSAIFGFANIGATIVDSLDTLYVMRMVKEFEAAREWVANHLNFNQVCVCTYICVCVVCQQVCLERTCVLGYSSCICLSVGVIVGVWTVTCL